MFVGARSSQKVPKVSRRSVVNSSLARSEHVQKHEAGANGISRHHQLKCEGTWRVDTARRLREGTCSTAWQCIMRWYAFGCRLTCPHHTGPCLIVSARSLCYSYMMLSPIFFRFTTVCFPRRWSSRVVHLPQQRAASQQQSTNPPSIMATRWL